MKPLRPVAVATSGATVTRYGAASCRSARPRRSTPNPSWVDTGRAARPSSARRTWAGTGNAGRPGTGGRVRCRARAWHHRAAGDPSGNRSHSLCRRQIPRRPQPVDLLPCELRVVVAGAPRDRQPPPLHRVGEHDRRPVGHRVALGVGVEKRADVVPPEVEHQRREVGIRHVGQRPLDIGRCALPDPGAQVGTGRARTAPGTRRRARRRASCAGPARTAARTSPAAAGRSGPPARATRGGEQRRALPVAGDRHDPVEGLPVAVDDPQHVAQPGRDGIGHRLPHAALVQFGVAEQRDEPAALPRPEVLVDVATGDGGEQRRDGPQPERARREVDPVGVAGPARVRLEAATRPEPREVAPVQPAEQVLDRVVHRGGVRLDADAVGTVEVGEVQRCHRRDQAGAARLMPADRNTVPAVALAVGRVDHADGEPQDPVRDLVQHVRVRAAGAWVAHGSGIPAEPPGRHPRARRQRGPDRTGRGAAEGRLRIR